MQTKKSLFNRLLPVEELFSLYKKLGKTIITEIDLRNSIFDDEANFLDITSKKREKIKEQFIGEPIDIKVSNRETARIIKNFYDNSNNIIEANRFYKLEMEKRREEFKNFPSGDYRTLESIIFWFHRISSNHSQSWFLAFFWIVSITFLFSGININMSVKDTLVIENNLKCAINLIFVVVLATATIFTIYHYFKKKNVFYSALGVCIFTFYIVYANLTNDYFLSNFSNILNPFSIMTNGEELTFISFLYKIIIAYLIYQLIISIRQNTRRK